VISDVAKNAHKNFYSHFVRYFSYLKILEMRGADINYINILHHD
jgi:hypothetical protein